MQAEKNILRIGHYYDVVNNFEEHGIDIIKEENGLLDAILQQSEGLIEIRRRDDFSWELSIFDFFLVDNKGGIIYLMTKTDTKTEMMDDQWHRKIIYTQECI